MKSEIELRTAKLVAMLLFGIGAVCMGRHHLVIGWVLMAGSFPLYTFYWMMKTGRAVSFDVWVLMPCFVLVLVGAYCLDTHHPVIGWTLVIGCLVVCALVSKLVRGYLLASSAALPIIFLLLVVKFLGHPNTLDLILLLLLGAASLWFFLWKWRKRYRVSWGLVSNSRGRTK